MCSTTPPLTTIVRDSNGTVFLTIDEEVGKNLKEITCCWAPVIRPTYNILESDNKFDSKIR